MATEWNDVDFTKLTLEWNNWAANWKKPFTMSLGYLADTRKCEKCVYYVAFLLVFNL